MGGAVDLERVRDRLRDALDAIEADPARRRALLADPRRELVAAGVPLPEDGHVEAAVGPGGRLFVGIPISAEETDDPEAPGPLHSRPHHADCA